MTLKKKKKKKKKNVEETTFNIKKYDMVLWTYLNEKQVEIYKCFINSSLVDNVVNTGQNILSTINSLKKVCDHPRLLKFSEIDRISSQLIPTTLPINGYQSESGKLNLLVSLVTYLYQTKQRVLIFSLHTRMLDLIEQCLHPLPFLFYRIDGTTTVKDRQALVDEFNANSQIFCMLLSTKSSGVGLNLTGANRVIIYEPSWNPTTEDQAIDRAFRIGQTKQVHVYRLITCGTVEETMYRRQVYKTSLINLAQKRSSNQIISATPIKNTNLSHNFTSRSLKKGFFKPQKFFTKSELKDLFSLNNHKLSLVFQILKQANQTKQLELNDEINQDLHYFKHQLKQQIYGTHFNNNIFHISYDAAILAELAKVTSQANYFAASARDRDRAYQNQNHLGGSVNHLGGSVNQQCSKWYKCQFKSKSVA